MIDFMNKILKFIRKYDALIQLIFKLIITYLLG
nr:MAG TPA: hypothetical protein [Caudoviricetes sp.]